MQRLTAFPAAVEIETARLRMKLPPRKTVAAPADSVPGENPQKSAERGGVEAFPAVQRKIHRKILLGDSGVRLTGHDRRTNPERRELQIVITGLLRRRHRKNPLLRIEGSGSRRRFVSAVIETAIAQLLRRKLFLAGQNRQPERRGIPRRNKMLLRRRRPAGDHSLRPRNAGQPDVPDLGESRIGPEPVGMNQDADRLQRRRERFPAVLRGGCHRETNLLEIRIAAAQLRRMFMNPAGRILKPDGDPRRSRPDLEPELFGIRIIHGESNGGVTAAERKIPIQPQHTVPAGQPAPGSHGKFARTVIERPGRIAGRKRNRLRHGRSGRRGQQRTRRKKRNQFHRPPPSRTESAAETAVRNSKSIMIPRPVHHLPVDGIKIAPFL